MQLHVLLTGFELDAPALVADATIVAVAACYLAGVLRLRRRGRRWAASFTASFLGGLVIIFVAIGSGLAAYDDINFSAHVVQHIFLMMVAPPLLVLGHPLKLLLQASRRPVQTRAARLARSRLVGALAGPAGVVSYFSIMWCCFLTPLYPWSIHWQALHDAVHVLLVLTGIAYWQFVLQPDSVAHRTSHLRRVIAIIVGMPLEMYLGFTLHAMDHGIGGGTTGAGVRAGGELFWWLSMLVSGVALALAIGQWVSEDERAARRADAAAEAQDELALPAES